MNFEQIRDIVVEAMGSRLKLDAEAITENTEFIADLHADSVDIATIICEIEDELNIEIDDEQLEGIKTLGDVMEKVEAMA